MRTEEELQYAHDILQATLEINDKQAKEHRMPDDVAANMASECAALGYAIGCPVCGEIFEGRLKHLRETADECGLVLVKDETQTEIE